MTDDSMRAFFTAYAAALLAGDLATIAAGYALPALVLSDAGSIPLGNPDQIAAAAHAAVEEYRSRSITAILPRLTRFEPISITWLYRDDTGETVLTEAYRYLMRDDETSGPLIQVVISRPVM
jgi:hypothetical protein